MMLPTNETPDMDSVKTQQEYLELIEANWDTIGDCGSCGWHALFHEHQLDTWDIGDAQDNDGNMTVCCINKYDDSFDHRGARFNIYELSASADADRPPKSTNEKRAE